MDGRLEKSLEPINPFPWVQCFAGEPPDDFPELFQDKRAGIERLIKVLIFCMEYMVRYMVVPSPEARKTDGSSTAFFSFSI